MNQLTKFLVNELVDGKSVTAIYGGGFKPPTKGHFDLVKTALKDFKDIDKFIIYVGGGVRDGIEQEQSMQVWDIYKELLPSKVQIEPSATPIGDILRYAKNHPDEKVYFVIGYREGREDDLQDIKNRTKGVEDKYPNLEVRVIKTPAGDMSGTNARKALQKGDKEKFFTYLPTEIPANEKEDIYNILEPNIFKEGSCGYDIDVKSGRKLNTPGGLEESDPKVGTGKKPKGSGRRLYTDEDPSDTVKVKFSTKQDIIDTLSKASFKSKSHARQSQIINLIHQRVRAAYERAKDPDVKRRLKTALDYAEQRKEASKEKTERLRKENVAPNHTGKAAPFGSGYKELKEKNGFGGQPRYRAIEKRGDKYYYIQDNPFAPGIRQEFGPYKTKEAAKRKMGTFPPSQNYRDITENTIPSIDILEKIAELTNYMRQKGYNIDPVPSIVLVDDDVSNAEKFLGKTAYYNPINKSITLYTYGRHPKDIVRSFSHEMIHHIQNLEGRLGDVSTTNTLEDDHINDLEKEANLKGTMTFRNWTDSIEEDGQKTSNKNMDDYKKQNNPSGKVKDPFGLNQYARELAQGLEEEIIGDKIKCDNCGWTWKIVDGGDDLYICHKCNHDNTPQSLNENILANIIAKLAAPLVNYVIGQAIDGLFGYIDDIKNIVAPEPYIKFLKGLEKNDEFNKQFIELIVQRDKEKKTPLGNEWRELITNLPAFKEAFDKFAEEQDIEEVDKNNLLFKISITMWDTYLRAWKKIHQTLKKRYPDLTQDLREIQLTEGRYDKLTNELSSFAFELMKDGYNVGRKVVDELFVVGPADEEVDIVSDEFEFDFVVQAVYTDDVYSVNGGANAGYIKKGKKKQEIQPLLTVRFEIPKNVDWQTVSFDIKDVIRHELEHLTQDGANVKGVVTLDDPRAQGDPRLVRPGKQMVDDEFLRDMIDANLLPKSDYFKLEKEVDAMLQGMYFKAKKSRKPFLAVIDDYLDKQPVNQKERKNILDLWAKRAKALSLPSLSSDSVKETSYLHDTGVEKKDEEMRGKIGGKKPVIFCDMDGVLVDFDEGYKQLTGVTTQHADSQGKNEFWSLFRDSLKEKDIPERSYWANLDWMPDGKQLWDYIKDYNPYVLTAPSVNFDIPFEERYKMENNESMPGNTEWVQRLPNMRKIYFRSAGRKADFAGPGKILIDDRKDTIDSWNANGGIGILHTSAANTIKQLQELGL